MTYQEPTHELGRIMLARHKARDCIFGCPFCKQDEESSPSSIYWELTESERQDAEDEAFLIISHYETDVTMKQVRTWDDYDLQFWLDAWANED